MAEHAALATEFGDHSWLHLDGSLAWAAAAEDGDVIAPSSRDHRLGLATTTESSEILRARAAHLRARGYPIESLSPEQVTHELEPGLRLDRIAVTEVWYVPGEGWADVPKLIDSLLRCALVLGAMVRTHDTVVAVDHRADRVFGISLSGGERLTADVVVNCAGPFAGDVAVLTGSSIPLARVPGYLPFRARLRCGYATSATARRFPLGPTPPADS